MFVFQQPASAIIAIAKQHDELIVLTMKSNDPHHLRIQWHRAINEVPQENWDRLAQPLPTPLLEWRWLQHLEASGSIAPDTGWHPRHMTVWRGKRLVGAAPLYIKMHSNGEFVFDQWWARWAGEAGIPYYPKLVGMSPVTPAVGYRFLIDPEADGARIQHAMFAALHEFCGRLGLSGAHLLFVDPQWMDTLGDNGFIPWQHQSYSWRNPGFTSFEDYLRPFKSIQRRNIRRERRQMKQLGITIRALRHEELTPEMAQIMYHYYANTNAQYGPWAAKYLNSEFFARIFRDYRERLLVLAAYLPTKSDRPMALSLLLFKAGQLIGRYWGCARAIKDLHFNMCFYEPIQWAIDHRIQTFDPGAGSPHKIYRGFEAVPNTSLHRFYQPHLRLLFERFIDGINQVEQENIHALNEKLPFAVR